MVTTFVVAQCVGNVFIGYSVTDIIHKHYGHKIWNSIKAASINMAIAYGGIYG